MKKAITIVAAALFFIAGAMNLNAKNKLNEEDEFYYGWITSCGIDVVFSFPFELDDEACVDFLDFFEDIFCDIELD